MIVTVVSELWFCPSAHLAGRVTGRWSPQGGPRKRARAAEWDTLLMCCARKGTEGSNPSASALDLGSTPVGCRSAAAGRVWLADRIPVGERELTRRP